MFIKLEQLQDRRTALQDFELLPLFYALPQPLLVGRKMDKFPRNPLIAISSPKWRKLYRTVGWRAEVADIWALTIWPYLGIRGGNSNYSTRDPFVILAYSLPLWASYLTVAGFSLDTLATLPYDAVVNYLTEEQTDTLCKDMAKIFWYDPNVKAQQLLEIVKEHRAHEDFANRKSTVRIDFHRKYYHTRAKNRPVQLGDMLEEALYVPEDDLDLQNVIANDWVEKFYEWLGRKKEIDICRLRCLGCTQKQIADRLGYKNHSGVNKRIKYIADILEAYIDWQQGMEEAPSPTEPVPSNIKYDEIEFTYVRK